uniref:DUF4116 domain-containing protein n=1 Tax=Macrostomum lignano TaxID=282301 RepID=A0A1I8FKV8_9PLAT
RVKEKKCNMSSLAAPSNRQKHSEDDRQQYKYQALPPYADKVYLARQKKNRILVNQGLCSPLGYEDAQHQANAICTAKAWSSTRRRGDALVQAGAAERGHPHTRPTMLAVGPSERLAKHLKPGEARQYLHRAAAKGIIQAHDMLNDACAEQRELATIELKHT